MWAIEWEGTMGKTLFVIAIFLCISSMTLAKTLEAPQMEAINQFVEAQMRRQQIPGCRWRW